MTSYTKEYRDDHNRVFQKRGKASAFDCIDCGEQARDWSHTHDTDPSQPENYQPRCPKCHRIYDAKPWPATRVVVDYHVVDGKQAPMMMPLPLRDVKARTERVSTYVELPMLRFLEGYMARMGARSLSEVIRRLTIIGAIEEGYDVETERVG